MVLLDAQPADAFTALPDYPATIRSCRTVYSLSPSLARIGLLGPAPRTAGRRVDPGGRSGARDEIVALPDGPAAGARVHESSATDRSIVVTAGSGQQAGWLDAQDRMPGLSTNSSHRVLATATHNSIICGVDAEASSQAILDVVSSVRTGTAVR